MEISEVTAMPTYKDNWEETERRFEAYWNKDYIDRCCLAIAIPREGGKPVFPTRKPTPEEHFSDPQTIHEGMLNGCAQTEYLAEAIPSRIIEFGVAGQCQFFGCCRPIQPLHPGIRISGGEQSRLPTDQR